MIEHGLPEAAKMASTTLEAKALNREILRSETPISAVREAFFDHPEARFNDESVLTVVDKAVKPHVEPIPRLETCPPREPINHYRVIDDIQFTENPGDTCRTGDLIDTRYLPGQESDYRDGFQPGGRYDVAAAEGVDKSVIFLSKDFGDLPLDIQRDVRDRMREKKVVLVPEVPQGRIMSAVEDGGSALAERKAMPQSGPEKRTDGDKPAKPEGKDTFYDKVDKDAAENGYKPIPEGELTQGKGDNRYVKPGDGILIKGDEVIVLEKKAPRETSQSGKGLKTDYIKDARADVDRRVKNKEISPQVGLHETKIAQAEYNADNVKKGITGTKHNNADIEGKTVRPGYSAAKSESANIESALRNKGIEKYEKIEGSNGTVTYVWDLRK